MRAAVYISVARDIILNPVYTGALVANRRTEAKFFRPGPNGTGTEMRPAAERGKRSMNPPSYWNVCEDAHPAIISRDLFEAAEARRRARVKAIAAGKNVARNGKGARSVYLLSHVARCARCGSPYYGKATRKGGSDTVTVRYICGGYFSKGKETCRMGPVPLEAIEGPLLDMIRELYFRVIDERKLEGAIRAALGVGENNAGTALAKLRKRDAEIVAKIDLWLEHIDAAHADVLNEKLARAKEERREIAGEITRLEAAAREQFDVALAVREIRAILDDLGAALESTDPADKKRVVTTFVKRVTMDYEAGEAVVDFRPLGSLTVGRGEPLARDLQGKPTREIVPISRGRKTKRQ